MGNKRDKLRFFSWFRSELKIKRWLLLAVISVIAICYALSIIFVTNTLNMATIFKIICLFIFGFAGIVVSYISMQKRTLEIMVKQTDKRDNVKSLIYNKKVYSQGPKIVVIGGGTGLNAVLSGLKKYTDNITAVVTGYEITKKTARSKYMAFYTDDIKESIIALSKNENEMRKLMEYKLSSNDEKSISFGDMYFKAMQDMNSDLSKSIEKVKDVLNITGRVLPVTPDEYEICADLSDGTSVKGKSQISDSMSEHVAKIERVYLSPSNIKASPEVISAIKEADCIVIGPGSIYTSVVPNLLVKGISKALKETKAFTVFVSNIMTQPGETYNYSLSDHIKAIKRHIGEASIDYCLYDTGDIIPEYIRTYNVRGSDLVDQDIQKAKAEGVKLMKRDLATIKNKYIRHDADSLAAAIIDLICEDLKFKDKQNDPEYLYLKQKLKYKKIKSSNGSKWKKRKIDKSGKSKFYSKYEERLKSIKESDDRVKRAIATNKRNSQIMERVTTMKKMQNSKKQESEVQKKKIV